MLWAWGAPAFSKSPHFKNFFEPRDQGRSPPPPLPEYEVSFWKWTPLSIKNWSPVPRNDFWKKEFEY